MARKKHTWLRSLSVSPQPCAGCGYVEIDKPVQHPQQQAGRSARHGPNVFPYAGPSADCRCAGVFTPEREESAMEEGLLIGSDFDGGYQTMDADRDEETTVEQPESVVVGKGKGKGKAKKKDATPAKNSASHDEDPPA